MLETWATARNCGGLYILDCINVNFRDFGYEMKCPLVVIIGGVGRFEDKAYGVFLKGFIHPL